MTRVHGKLLIVEVGASDLLEDPHNPNKMSKDDFAALIANIKAHGFWQPILVKELDTEESGFTHAIVDGHHRARAAWAAGLGSIPAVVWDGTEAMRQAFAVGMNKIRGELDLGGVAQIIQDLTERGWGIDDLKVTGFSHDELEALIKTTQPEDTDEILQGSNTEQHEDKEPGTARPFTLELTFATASALQQAKKGLRRAAGKGRELGEGLLSLLGKTD